MNTRLLYHSALSLIIPLAFISTAIALSPWFSFGENALSDLGNTSTSPVAPIFNLGLAIGSFYVFYLAVKYMYSYDRLRGPILVATGFFLNLVAVFNEVYGILHFIVSVIFFLTIIVYLLVTGIREKKLLRIIVGAIDVVIWYFFLAYDVPLGIAVPELFAILTYAPFYILDYAGTP